MIEQDAPVYTLEQQRNWEHKPLDAFPASWGELLRDMLRSGQSDNALASLAANLPGLPEYLSDSSLARWRKRWRVFTVKYGLPEGWVGATWVRERAWPEIGQELSVGIKRRKTEAAELLERALNGGV